MTNARARIGQRLNDISTKIVERLRPIIGFTIGQNSLRKIKAQLPKHLKHIPQTLKNQTWLYLNGQDNPIFRSPRHQAKGKPIRLTIPQPKPKPKPKQNIIYRVFERVFGKQEQDQINRDLAEDEQLDDELLEEEYIELE